MNYLVAPLHAHFDSGFGATGNAFKEAADYLDKSEHAKENDLFNANLPINVLYRHAIELFLRSAIVIFHRRLRIPFGDAPWDGEPMVLVAERWEPFNRVHGIETLWAYVPKLFVQHAEWLAKNTKADWTLPVELDDQVKTIQQSDPRSTFFRYPTTKDSNADVSKSAMKEVTADEMTERFRTSTHRRTRSLRRLSRTTTGNSFTDTSTMPRTVLPSTRAEGVCRDVLQPARSDAMGKVRRLVVAGFPHAPAHANRPKTPPTRPPTRTLMGSEGVCGRLTESEIYRFRNKTEK